ncbi:MAG TPA: ribonuclease HI [Nitrososphaerales archaeon]|nr:ribonuclease HI [Nitrososphaerales archaeon]
MRNDNVVNGSRRAEEFILNFDGLCQPKNPGGIATYGVVIRKDGLKVFEGRGLAEAKPWSEEASNNVAEYSGLIRGLEWLKRFGHLGDQILVRGDSKLVINQLNGAFKIKAPRLVELYRRAEALLSEFKKVRIEWVERSLNSDADNLSRIAYARYLKTHSRAK